MLNWMKKRGPAHDRPRERDAEPPPIVSSKYLLLFRYLHDRYADRVVLTFGQIESLLGFSLPDQARLNKQWWTNAAVTPPGSHCSDAWILARRVATPNLLARTVAFGRAS